MIFRSFDLETTSVDVETCVVVQAAIVDAVASADHFPGGQRTTHSQLFAAHDVPIASTRVHRITDRNPERFTFPVRVIPSDASAFLACVQSMAVALTEPDVVSVSFNGCGYDIPIVARYLHSLGGDVIGETLGSERRIAGQVLSPHSREWVELRLRQRHIDVMRLWARARAEELQAPWLGELDIPYRDGDSWRPALTADMFAGGLTPAHGFWLGRGFDSAHDASVDCHATLDVLREMLVSGFVDVDTAIKWSNEPLPGDVDFDGKFKWNDDQVVISFGKHSGTPIEDLPASYLTWMLTSDFPTSTKALIRGYLQGAYPARAYEDETP